MSKRRRKRRSRRSTRRPSIKLLRALTTAMETYNEGEVELARQQLFQLIRQYPRSKPVLMALLEVSSEMQDWRTYAYYGEQLLPLEQGEDQAETRNNLIYAYVQLLYPALAWHHASELKTKPFKTEYFEQAKSLVETTEPLLLQEANIIIDSNAFTQDEKLELMVLNDHVRFLTESSRPEEAIRAAELLLEKIPGTVPVLNNLSMSQFIKGDVQQAIATAQNVLTIDPDNFHALGNLVRYTFLTAQFDEAQAYALRLQQIANDIPDLEMKQAEAFAFLGDDAQVWAAYERAKTKSSDLSPLLLHLAAVAAYRLGNEKTAWKLWQQAVKLMPSFELAQENLAEKRLSEGGRNIPWYWSFQYWFPQDLGQILEQYLGKNIQRMTEKSIERAMQSFLAERPHLSKLFPHMLERGDRQTREFVLNLIRTADTPEIKQMCYDFGRSRYGADDTRMEAIQFISQNYPEMLPENNLVPMWVDGKQTELFMMGFKITDEPEGFDNISEVILDKHEAACEMLFDDDPEAAEQILHEIIVEAPEFHSAYNQLALAYQMQGHGEKARKLVEETHALFPNYFFARITLARMLARDKQVEEAIKLVQPLLRLKKLHISEFVALAQAQMEIALADNQTEAARSWLEMWQNIAADDPEIDQWEMRISSSKLLRGLQNSIGRP